MDRHNQILILGLGNVLLGDLGSGIAALHLLRRRQRGTPGILYHRSGAISTSLMPLISVSHALLVLDSRPHDAPPGSMLELEGTDMDDGLLRYPSADTMLGTELARLSVTGELPENRAMLIIQPALDIPSSDLSPEVSIRIPEVVNRAGTLISNWNITMPFPYTTALV